MIHIFIYESKAILSMGIFTHWTDIEISANEKMSHREYDFYRNITTTWIEIHCQSLTEQIKCHVSRF